MSYLHLEFEPCNRLTGTKERVEGELAWNEKLKAVIKDFESAC